MKNEIIGNSYRYVIDKSYGINKDGFIAIGTESIVYKGLKTKVGGKIQFSCVLKFKPKKVKQDGIIVDKFDKFNKEEWKIFEELRECRSIVHIDDVIDDLGEFSIPCEYIESNMINGEAYFCVVEEYIDGWNLDEFCREEFWKIRTKESIGNGLQKIVEYNDYTEEQKKQVLPYTYENILKYQNQILAFMINLCEIMEFVSEQKDILHLDIKPENIMVTRHGKELVLIDFGRSQQVTKANKYYKKNNLEVDYNENETMESMYQYGTLGYAAPECFYQATPNSKFPFKVESKEEKVSMESDIFSFGATFWECLNMYELVTKNREFSEDPHDFYRKYFMNDTLYCSRDLSLTSCRYHKKLESVIKKCTRVRDVNHMMSEKFYHSYTELRRDLEDVKDSVPTIVREENVKASNSFKFFGSMTAITLVFFIISSIYHLSAFNIAERKWNELQTTYNDTQFYMLEEVASDMFETASLGQKKQIYDEISSFTYQKDDISEYECELLVKLLKNMDNTSMFGEYIDDIMKHANIKKFKEISTQIVSLGNVEDSVGYNLAKAIYDIEIGKKEKVLESYDILKMYKDNQSFRNAVVKLKNVLNSDEYISVIMQKEGVSRQEVLSFFESIG